MNSQKVFKLTGINDLQFYTLRHVEINIFGYPTIFNTIPNEVRVEKDGVLGSEFFKDNNVNVNYILKCLQMENHNYPFKSTNTLSIPARTVTIFYVQVKNMERSKEYIPRFHIQDGVYVGDAVVKNHKGKAYFKFVNINEIPITLLVPIINLEDLKNKIIEPSQSPCNTPVWIVPKKPDSQGNIKWRMVLDFCKLNKETIGDSYPLLNINDILDSLGSAKYFSVFDLATGFHHIKMDPKDSHKTAFSTPHGLYEFDRKPFGLETAPATFQRLMDLTLTGLIGTKLFV